MTREMTVTHTPGPWEWRRDGGAFFLSPGVLVTNFTDGTLWGDELDQANAHLIAAAPDLLEALHQCLGTLKALDAEYGYAAEAARAAIAKAEGRS